VLAIMTQKFVMAVPLSRQKQEWARQGLKLSRQTKSNWMLWAAEHWLKCEELLAKMIVQVKAEIAARQKILCKSIQPQSKKQEQNGTAPEAGTV